VMRGTVEKDGDSNDLVPRRPRRSEALSVVCDICHGTPGRRYDTQSAYIPGSSMTLYLDPEVVAGCWSSRHVRERSMPSSTTTY
jgi:hypothetical protein